MGQQKAYGRSVLRRAFGSTFSWTSPLGVLPFGDSAGSARLDGVIDADIVVEIESRTPKQMRGAILNLLAHPIGKKLLVLIPARMHDPSEAAVQARVLLERMCRQQKKCAVVLLAGTARSPNLDEDLKRVIAAVGRLREVGTRQLPSDGGDSRVCDTCHVVVPIGRMFGGHCDGCEGRLRDEYDRLNDELMADSNDDHDFEEPDEELELASQWGERSEFTDWDEDGAEIINDTESYEPEDDM